MAERDEDTSESMRFPLWTTAIVDEFTAGPVTPLDHDLVWDRLARPAWRALLTDRLGFSGDQIDTSQPEIVTMIDGRMYLNASLLRVWAARMPVLAPQHIDAAFLTSDGLMPPFATEPWHDRPDLTAGALTEWLRWVLVTKDQSALSSDYAAAAALSSDRPAFDLKPDVEVFAHLDTLAPLGRRLFSHYLEQTLAASVGPGIVAAMATEVGLPTAAIQLIAALGDVESAATLPALWTLSRLVRSSTLLSSEFDAGLDGLDQRLRASNVDDALALCAALDALRSELGFVSQAEWELTTPSWFEDPVETLAVIDTLRRCDDDRNPTLTRAQREADRETMVAGVAGLITESQNGDATSTDRITAAQYHAAIASTAVFVRGRELARAALARVMAEMRIVVGELGTRAEGHGDVEMPEHIGFLNLEELGYYADGGLSQVKALIDNRRQAHAGHAGVRLRQMVDGRHLNSRLSVPETGMADAGEVLLGSPGSAAEGRGRVRIHRGRGRPGVEPGDVLVVDRLPVSWTPYLVACEAVVVSSGSLLAHGAVAARELGIAVVTGVVGAQDRLRDGMVLDVDGVTGIVTVVETANAERCTVG